MRDRQWERPEFRPEGAKGRRACWNAPLWLKDHFELKLTAKKQTPEKLSALSCSLRCRTCICKHVPFPPYVERPANC